MSARRNMRASIGKPGHGRGMQRSATVFAAGAAYLLAAGCTYVPDEANPVEWFKGAREWVGDRKTEEQEKAEAKAKTLRMPNQDAPFPNLSSVPERPDRSAAAPAAATASTLQIDRDSALSGDAAVRERDSDFVIEPPPARKPRPTARKRKPAPAARTPAKRPPPVPRLPERSRPPPPPVIPDLPATGQQSELPGAAPWLVLAVASDPNGWAALRMNVAGRSSARGRVVPARVSPADPPQRLGPFAGGLEPSPQPRRTPKRRTSAPAEIVPAIPSAPKATVRPAAEVPIKLKFGPPPTDIDPFGTSQPPAEQTRRTPPLTTQRPGVSRAALAGRNAAAAALRRSTEADGPRRIGTVLFANGSASVGSAGRRILRSAVVEHRKQGGTLRIVGHASSGATGENDPVRHRMANLNMSLDRANAVARELVKLGIDRKAIVVSAMADSRPAVSENAPGSAAKNRRAEIYLGN